jgi:choline kinase
MDSSSRADLLPLHVVILAAGRGSRLADGETRPKWLLETSGGTLAERHMEGIAAAAHAGAVASVRVVTGHVAEAIESFAAGHDEIELVPNPEYAELNNWWSLLRALRELPGEGPVAVLNADLLIDPDHLADFLFDAAATSAEALICVDLERQLTDESMKVSRGDGKDGALARIGKVGIDDAVGEYVGMLMARGSALAAMRAQLERFVGRPECADEWYEGAVGRSAADGAEWRIWPMPSGDWVEIDDDEDLARARTLVGLR